MASTSTKPKAADAPEYEPDRLYSVQLTEAVEHPPGSGQMFSPANPVQVKGKLAATWGDKVSDAQPVR